MPVRQCHTGARHNTSDPGEKEPSPRCSGAETQEHLSKLQPLQVMPSWCCQQEGETCPLGKWDGEDAGSGGQQAEDTVGSDPAAQTSRAEHGVGPRMQIQAVSCFYKKTAYVLLDLGWLVPAGPPSQASLHRFLL